MTKNKITKNKIKLNLKKKVLRQTDTSNTDSQSVFPEEIVMSEQNFSELQSIIYNTSGFYISGGNKYRINKYINENLVNMNLEGIQDYLSYINKPEGKKEIYNIVGSISIQNDKFFANMNRIRALVSDIIPNIIENTRSAGNNKVNIWFTNTSRGEEVYSIAIVLAEQIIPQYPDMQFKIYASDINRSLIEFANEAEYNQISIENVRDELLDKYFIKKKRKYAVTDNIKYLVKFRKIVLFDRNQISSLPKMDLVFCSSILVYFDLASRQKLVSNIKKAMNDNSYLILGKNESLGNIDHGMELIHFNKLMAYKVIPDQVQ